MRLLPAAALPPGPKPKLPAVEVDSPKRGELKLAIGLDKFVVLRRFWICTENVKVYRFSGVGALAGLAVPAGAEAPAGGAEAGAAADGAAGTFPNMNARLIPRFTEKKLGPTP